MKPKSTNNTTEFFDSSDQMRRIFYQTHQSVKPCKASLIITHGLGEHSDAYNHISEALSTDFPINVISWDMTGHGKSSGQRGYVGDISWLVKDFSQLLQLTASKTKKPIYLLSHSLGGLITLTAEQNGSFDNLNIKGLILSNPCTKLNFEPPKWKTLGAEFLTKMAPRVTLSNEISPKQLASDPAYLKTHKADPLRHSKISPRLYLGMIELISNLKPQSTETPTLLLLSPQDSICDAQNTAKLLKNRSRIVSFDHSMHEVLNDIEKEVAISKIKEFLNENI